MSRFFEGAGGKKIYVPTPTWGNHIPIFKDSGLEVVYYRYFDKKTNGLDFAGMTEDLSVHYFTHKHDSNRDCRKSLMRVLYCFMLVLTTQLVLIQPKLNGKNFPNSAKRKRLLPSLIWPIKDLHLVIAMLMPLLFVTLLQKVTRLLFLRYFAPFSFRLTLLLTLVLF